jgi:hypothetical protein
VIRVNFGSLVEIGRTEFRERATYELHGEEGKQTPWTAALFAAEKVSSLRQGYVILVMGTNYRLVDDDKPLVDPDKPLFMSPFGGESPLETVQLFIANMILQVLEQDTDMLTKGAGANGIR